MALTDGVMVSEGNVSLSFIGEVCLCVCVGPLCPRSVVVDEGSDEGNGPITEADS